LSLSVDEKAAKIGLKSGEEGTIPFSEMTWARQSLSIVKPEDINTTVQPAFVGPSLSHPQDALSIGDVVLVERLKGKEDAYSLQQIPAVSGALVVMDAHTGRVLAMTGGFSFEASQFNRATQALRQPGSAIKPFVYLAAMERGFSPATVVSDAPISIAMGRGLGTYSPKNVKTTNYGSVPLRVGLQKSLNRMTIRLVHEYIGMKSVAKMIEKFGVMDRVPMQIAMAIGAGESTLLRMITAYASLANGGKKLEPTLIDRIQDRHGKTIFASDTRLCSGCQSHTWLNQETPVIEDRREQLADPRSIYQITSMLEGAVRAGSAKKAQSLGKILAIKTGTTNEERDAWTFAFTPEGIVVGTYIGFDNPQPMGHLEGGSRVALPIIIDFMGMTLEGVPSKPFKMPPGMKLVRMREMTGGSAQLGDTGVIYEALKENQSLHGRSSYDSETSYGRFSDSYDPETSYERSSNSYDPETSYERSSNSYDPGTSYGRSSNSYEGSLPGTYEEVGTYSSPSLAPVDSSLTGTGGLY
jgi:penicillin-binding protein 1A